MRIIGNDPSVPRQTQEVASGTLPSGKPVIVNSDGTVSVASSTTFSAGFGSKNSIVGDANYITAAYDSANNKLVIAYRDGNNSNYGTAVIGSISGSTVTFGTPVVFSSASQSFTQTIYDSSSGKVVILFYKNDTAISAIVGTVSGTSISFGSIVSVGATPSQWHVSGAAVGSSKIVVAYRNNSDNYHGYGVVGTISGTSISFGTAVEFENSETETPSVAYDSGNDKVVISYEDAGNSNYGTAVVGTVSGTSISFGSAATFDTNGGVADIGSAYDANAGKIVIVYEQTNGYAIVGTVSGTSISFGSRVLFQGSAIGTRPGVVYNSIEQKVYVHYQASSNGQLTAGTVSGTSISFSYIGAVTGGSSSSRQSIAFISDQNALYCSFRDSSDDVAGTIYQLAYTQNTLTSENYIGMSSGTAFQTGSAASAGSPVVFESAEIDRTQTVFDSQNNKIVIAYRDAGNSYYGTAIVGTVDNSDNSISFGTPVVVESATLGFFGTLSFDSSNNKVVVPYEIGSQGKVKIGTVSGTGISFGSAVNISDPGTSITTVFDSNSNKVAFLYNGTSNYTKSKVGTVSGTSISFGTEVNVASAEPSFTSGAFDSNANKVVFAYRRSVAGRAIVGTISGTDISFGTEYVFHNTNAQQTSTTFDTSSNKIVISYQDYSASPRAGNAVVGTVSGTDISFGSPVTFNTTIAEDTAIVFDSSVNKVIIFYDDADNSNYGTAISGTVSGTTVSFDSETVFESASVEKISAAFDSNANRAVVAYEDVGNSQYGTAVVFNPTTIATTRGQVADGGHALIDTQGAISDNQIGLTAGQSYFVQNDGTIGTTAADPSVFAGTAVSATKLIVKG